MRLDLERHDDWTVVHLTGPLDALAAREAQRDLLDLLETAPGPWYLDMEGVDHIDSAGLAALVKFYREVRARGGRMALCGVQREPMRVLHTTRLDRIFSIHPTSDAAKAA
jgi:anti-sigma B factor antagonist